jgi:hypothetical protein
MPEWVQTGHMVDRRLSLSESDYLVERIRAASHDDTETGCWLWTRGRNDGGYGMLSFRGRRCRAHRLAAMVWLGLDPSSRLSVLHRCDTPACVNPDHLYVGTQADNCRDRAVWRRGREHRQSGTDNPRARLSWADVAEIRTRLASGARQVDIAATFGVGQSHISAIKRGVRWRMTP